MSTDKIDPSSKDPKISSTADSAKATQGELTEDQLKTVSGGDASSCSGTSFKTVGLGMRKSSGGTTSGTF
jgi:hypothetical protein